MCSLAERIVICMGYRYKSQCQPLVSIKNITAILLQAGSILSLIEMSAHITSSSKEMSSTLFHYLPLPTTTTTLFEYVPLSSTTAVTRTFYRTRTLSVSFETPTFTSRLASSLTSDTPSSSSTEAWGSDHAIAPKNEKLSPSTGLAIVILILFTILVGMTMTIWWMEPRACNDAGGSINLMETKSSQTRVLEPVGGLGMKIQSEREGTQRNIGYCERLRAWLVNSIRKTSAAHMMQRWSGSVVTALTTELGMDAEKGLLLPVREDERVGDKRHRIDFDILAEMLAA